MRLLDTYRMINPVAYVEELTHGELTALLEAVDDQLHKLNHWPRFAVTHVEFAGKYCAITFRLLDYKNSDYALIWMDTVERCDLVEFVRLSWPCDDPEQYLNEHAMEVATAWIKAQENE